MLDGGAVTGGAAAGAAGGGLLAPQPASSAEHITIADPASAHRDWIRRRERSRSSVMAPIPIPPFRRTAASKLRSLADWFEPMRTLGPPASAAPLVRFGGRWWQRDELIGEQQTDYQPPSP
jgi:hypothetical protein